MATTSRIRRNVVPKDSEAARQLAEVKLKQKEDQILAREGAMAEYATARRAVHENMARLKALRLARDSLAANTTAMAVELAPLKRRRRASPLDPAVATNN